MTDRSTGERASLAMLVLCAVLAVVAACAVADLGFLVADLASAFDTRVQPIGIAAALLYGAVVAVGMAIALRADRSPAAARTALVAGFALLVGLRLGLILAIDAPLIVDWRRYHDFALAILAGEPWVADRPSGLPMIMAAVYGVVGTDPRHVEIINLVAAVATGALIHRLGSRTWGARAGAAALVLYAVAPAQVLMTSLFSTETLYGLMLTVVVALVAREHAREAAGMLVLALSQLLRTTSLAFAPVVLVLAVRWRRPGRRAWASGALAAFGLAVGMLPVIVGTALIGRPSVASSSHVWWTLYIGANQETGGKWNEADLARVGGHAGTPEANRLSRELAIERIAADPVGTAVLYVRKIPTTWGDARYAARWTLLAMPEPDQRAVGVGALLSSAGWAGTTVLAALAAWAERRRPTRPTILVAAMVASLVLAHAVLEASARFHDPAVPILSLLAGAGAVRAATLLGARRRGTVGA